MPLSGHTTRCPCVVRSRWMLRFGVVSTTSDGPWRIGVTDEHVVPSRTFFSVGSAYLQALWQREREPLTVITSTYVGSKVQLEPSPIVRPPSATYSHAISPRFLTGRSLSN